MMNSRRYRVKILHRYLLGESNTKARVVKSVKVHDDTHRVLKEMKAQRRNKSVDEVIRELIKQSTGRAVEKTTQRKAAELTTFLSD